MRYSGRKCFTKYVRKRPEFWARTCHRTPPRKSAARREPSLSQDDLSATSTHGSAGVRVRAGPPHARSVPATPAPRLSSGSPAKARMWGPCATTPERLTPRGTNTWRPDALTGKLRSRGGRQGPPGATRRPAGRRPEHPAPGASPVTHFTSACPPPHQ